LRYRRTPQEDYQEERIAAMTGHIIEGGDANLEKMKHKTVEALRTLM
jgi:hypothetical protein